MNEIIKKAKSMLQEEVEKYKIPDPDAMKISHKKSLELCDKLGADREIVALASYLMDLKLGEAVSQKTTGKHTEMSLNEAKKLFKDYDLPEEKRKKIINCIEAHHFNKPFECIEAEICANAALFRIFHPRGFLKFLLHIKENMEFYGVTDFDTILERIDRELDEKIGEVSLDECKKEAEELYKKLNDIIFIARFGS